MADDGKIMDRKGKSWIVEIEAAGRVHLMPAPVKGEPSFFGTDVKTGEKTEYAIGADRNISADVFAKQYKVER